MKVLPKRKVAKAHGYIYKLDFKSEGEKIYSISKKGAKYDAIVNQSYTNFEKELSNVLEWNKD